MHVLFLDKPPPATLKPQTLEKMCWYAVLAPADSDQITLAANTAVRGGMCGTASMGFLAFRWCIVCLLYSRASCS